MHLLERFACILKIHHFHFFCIGICSVESGSASVASWIWAHVPVVMLVCTEGQVKYLSYVSFTCLNFHIRVGSFSYLRWIILISLTARELNCCFKILNLFLNISKCIWNGFFIDWLTVCWLRLVLQTVWRMWLKSEVDQRLWIRCVCSCQSVQCILHHLMVPSEFITSSYRADWSSNVKRPVIKVICLQKPQLSFIKHNFALKHAFCLVFQFLCFWGWERESW